MIRRALTDQRGVSAVEFGLIAPVLLLMLMGLCDLMYRSYAQALLDGALQKAGRDSAIQGGADRKEVLDAAVVKMVKIIAPDATWTSSRKSFSSFSVAKPEEIQDKNGNGRLDKNECFTDVNGNKSWDAFPSRTGQGGAGDVNEYIVEVTYPRLFPIAPMIGWSSRQTIGASTFLKNQPYARQVVTAESVCIK